MLIGRDPQSVIFSLNFLSKRRIIYSLQPTIQNPFLIYSSFAKKFKENMTEQYECSNLPEGILIPHNHLPIDLLSRE